MVDSLLFALVMLAIPWLVVWTTTDHSKPSEVWWPFDIRLGKAPPAPQSVKEPEPLRQLRQQRTPPERPWKRSGF